MSEFLEDILDPRQRDALAKAGVTDRDTAQQYLAEHGSFDPIKHIGRATSKQIVDFLGDLSASEGETPPPAQPTPDPISESPTFDLPAGYESDQAQAGYLRFGRDRIRVHPEVAMRFLALRYAGEQRSSEELLALLVQQAV